MIKTINTKLYQPIVLFFLLPLISLLPGTILALEYSPINYLSFIILYIYIVVNQVIENILLRLPVTDFEQAKKQLIRLELVNVLLLLYLGLRYSWISAAVLLLYTIIIQLQFLFSYYQLEKIAALLASALKVVLLNSLSFYVHTHFIHANFSVYYLALFFPYLIYELARTEDSKNQSLNILLVSISYLFPLILFWPSHGFLSLSLLISYPFFAAFIKENNPQYMPTFLILFSSVFFVLLSTAFNR